MAVYPIASVIDSRVVAIRFDRRRGDPSGLPAEIRSSRGIDLRPCGKIPPFPANLRSTCRRRWSARYQGADRDWRYGEKFAANDLTE